MIKPLAAWVSKECVKQKAQPPTPPHHHRTGKELARTVLSLCDGGVSVTAAHIAIAKIIFRLSHIGKVIYPLQFLEL